MRSLDNSLIDWCWIIDNFIDLITPEHFTLEQYGHFFHYRYFLTTLAFFNVVF